MLVPKIFKRELNKDDQLALQQFNAEYMQLKREQMANSGGAVTILDSAKPYTGINPYPTENYSCYWETAGVGITRIMLNFRHDYPLQVVKIENPPAYRIVCSNCIVETDGTLTVPSQPQQDAIVWCIYEPKA